MMKGTLTNMDAEAKKDFDAMVAWASAQVKAGTATDVMKAFVKLGAKEVVSFTLAASLVAALALF